MDVSLVRWMSECQASVAAAQIPTRTASGRRGVRVGGFVGCLDGAAVRRRTRDQKVAGSTPGRGAIKSTRSTQPSIASG